MPCMVGLDIVFVRAQGRGVKAYETGKETRGTQRRITACAGSPPGQKGRRDLQHRNPNRNIVSGRRGGGGRSTSRITHQWET